MRRIRIKLVGILFLGVILAGIFIGAFERERAVFAYGDPVSINEICYNFSVIANEDGKYRNYIELYNAGDAEIALDGYFLTDNKKKSYRYPLDGTVIEGRGYVIVYLSEEDELCADFDIDSEAARICLWNPGGLMADMAVIPRLKYNTSYARDSDGSGEWCLQTPTAGLSNADGERIVPEVLSEPILSAESGFYGEPFALNMTTYEDGKIYYSLDGSEPTPESFLYDGPIIIEDAAPYENRYSVRTDTTLGFLFGEEERFEVPDGPVDKATVVRAAVYSGDGMKKSATVTRTYFVGFEEKGYSVLPVMSVVTDPDCLFDYENGIYVLGKTFEDYMRDGPEHPDNWMRWEGNFMNRGREWERPAYIEYFDENREKVLAENSGIRIKGGASRTYVQKSMNLYARSIYSGKDTFTVPFFEDTAARRVTLFSGANDYKLKIRDALINNVCAGLSFATTKSRPCYLFLDGEYWGVYYVMEKLGDDYVEEHYKVPADDVIVVKNNRLDCGVEEDYWKFEELIDLAGRYDLSEEQWYEELCGLIDMQSFLDYYGTQIYIARCNDWPGENEGLWRSRSVTEKAYQDGKWRWMIYDLNWSESCMSEALADMDTFAYIREESALFAHMMEHDGFRRDFVVNFCDLANTCLSNEVVLPELERLIETMREPVTRDYGRFFGGHWTEEDYEAEAGDVYRFFEKRYEYIMDDMRRHFGLRGMPEELTIEVEETDGGYIIVNHVAPDLSDGSWSGNYFTDYPVTVTAVAKDGYRFAGWSGDIVSQEAELSVSLREGGVLLQAEFAKSRR